MFGVCLFKVVCSESSQNFCLFRLLVSRILHHEEPDLLRLQNLKLLSSVSISLDDVVLNRWNSKIRQTFWTLSLLDGSLFNKIGNRFNIFDFSYCITLAMKLYLNYIC